MNRRFVATLLATSLSWGALSCSNDPTPNDDDNDGSHPSTEEVTTLPTQRIGEIRLHAPVADIDAQPVFVGLGYDITAPFLSATALRGRVIDLAKIEEGYLSSFVAPSSQIENFVGNDAASLLRDMMQSSGFTLPHNGDLYFTGTFADEDFYADPYEYSTQYAFHCAVTQIRRTRHLLNTLGMKWERVLTDEFAAALREGQPERIIARYGTHLLKESIQGVTHYQLLRSVIMADDDNKARNLLICSGQLHKALTQGTAADLTQHWDIACDYYCMGGDPSLLPDPRQKIWDFQPWISSGAQEGDALVTLRNTHLIPIYEVVTNPSLRQSLKQAVERYIHSRQIAFRATVPLIEYTPGYRLFTSFGEMSALREGRCKVLGALYAANEAGTRPLYLQSENGTDRLSLQQGKCIGYIPDDASADRPTALLHEITDGRRYAYTTSTDRLPSSWHPTGEVFRLPHTSRPAAK